MDIDRYLPAAHYVAHTVPVILVQLGLKPLISRFVLTETEQGNAWLFAALELSPLEHSEDYTASDALDYLSTALHGLPVIASDSHGLHYAVLLSSPNLLDKPN